MPENFRRVSGKRLAGIVPAPQAFNPIAARRTSADYPPRDLPDQLQGKLNLPRSGLRRIDQSRALDGQAVLVEDRGVIGGRGKIRAIKILKISARNWALKLSEMRRM